MFFQIEEQCFFPILFKSKVRVRVGGENQCEMIQDEQLNDSLANFQSFRLMKGDHDHVMLASHFCARNNFF